MVAPLVLVAVAVTQLFVVANSDLTPWRGGGFGMFSTLDNHDLRQVRVELTTAGGERFGVDVGELLELDPPWVDEFVVARAHPSLSSLDALGRALADDPSVVAGAFAPSIHAEDAQSPSQLTMLEFVDVLRIEVWRVRFERTTNTLVPELIVSHQMRP